MLVLVLLEQVGSSEAFLLQRDVRSRRAEGEAVEHLPLQKVESTRVKRVVALSGCPDPIEHFKCKTPIPSYICQQPHFARVGSLLARRGVGLSAETSNGRAEQDYGCDLFVTAECAFAQARDLRQLLIGHFRVPLPTPFLGPSLWMDLQGGVLG